MKIGSLCSGYGGLDLAVEALTGAHTTWFSEFNPHAAKIFQQHFQVPNLGDLTKIDWTQVEPVDILTGGYPCQPFSTAGKREGQNDSRHLFPYIRDAISVLRPRIVFFENVRGHLSLGFDSVLQDLAKIGYDSFWTLARASAIGAPHRRERLFIVGIPRELTNSNGEHAEINERGVRGLIERFCGEDRLGGGSQGLISDTSSLGLQENNSSGFGRLEGRDIAKSIVSIANAISQRGQTFESELSSDAQAGNLPITDTDNLERQRVRELQGLRLGHDSRSDMSQLQDWGKYSEAISKWERITRPAPSPIKNNKLSPVFVEWLMGLPEGWVTDIDISRAQQLKALGNGVVPQQAFAAYRHLLGVASEY